MFVDWENGKTLEIKAILGLPIRIAARASARLERIQTMYALLTLWRQSCFKREQSEPG